MRIILAFSLLGLVACGDDGSSSTAQEKLAGTATMPPPTPMQQCKLHLQNLHGAMMEYQGIYGNFPWQTGAQYWVTFSTTTPAIISGPELAWYDCPITPGTPAPGTCEYRGPAGDINTYAADQVIAADFVGAHGINQGGHVLLKNGTVILCSETDYHWIVASSQTSP